MKFSDADLSETLECFGENHSDMVVLGKKLGTHAVREICGLMGGRKVHVPEFDNLVWDLKRAVRDEELRTKFRGNNLAELAMDYGMSARQVHRILHGDRKKYMRDHERTKGLRTSDKYHARIIALAEEHGMRVRMVVDRVLAAGFATLDLKRTQEHETYPLFDRV